MEILSRLKVKELVKMKSVCKRWFATISSNSSIHLHLHKSSFTAIRIAASCRVPCDGEECRPSIMEGEFLGSCDGLVCVLIDTHDTVAICNEALHQRRKLVVKLPPTIKEHGVKCCWFGRGDDHYKIIIGTTYRLSMQEFNKLYGFEEKLGTLFQNSVYWPASLMVGPHSFAEPQVPIIVSYDLGSGTTGELSPPQTNHHHILFFALMEGENQNFQIWAMKQHGVPESWTMLMDFPTCIPTWLRSPQRVDDDRIVTQDR